MDLIEFKKQLRTDGYNDVVDREMPAGQFVDTHSHPFDVHAVVTGGEIELHCHGETKTYREGDEFVMSAGISHTERYGPTGVKYIVGRRHRAD